MGSCRPGIQWRTPTAAVPIPSYARAHSRCDKLAGKSNQVEPNDESDQEDGRVKADAGQETQAEGGSEQFDRIHTRMISMLRFLVVAATFMPAFAQPSVRTYVEAHQAEILKEFTELVAIPNVASDRSNIGRNADLIQKMLGLRGIPSRLLQTAGAPPVVFGEIETAGAKRTLTFYAHYDGQPVDAKEWAGGNPFAPTLRSAMLEKDGKVLPMPVAGERIDPEWRLYGRATSDDKAPIVAMLAAVDALKANGTKLTSNIKFFFEGEEEAGSPHLSKTVRENASSLQGDVWLICDGPVSQNRQQQIYFGARGVTGLDLPCTDRGVNCTAATMGTGLRIRR